MMTTHDVPTLTRGWLSRVAALAGLHPVVLELGAHQGEDTCRIAEAFGGRASMWAFEPDPRNIPLMRSPLPAVLIQAAVTDRDGEATMVLASNRQSSSLRAPAHHLTKYPHISFHGEARVRTMKLDTFCSAWGIEAVDFLWADIQGAERDMVAGGQQILATTKFMFLESETTEVYQGQWTRDEMIEALAPGWGVVGARDKDLLFWNRTMWPGCPVAR